MNGKKTRQIVISAKNRNQTSSQKPDVSLNTTNSKIYKKGDARSHFLSVGINLC